MAMNFAPYQATSPESSRAVSPTPEGRRSFSPPSINAPSRIRSPPLLAPKPSAPNTAWALGNDAMDESEAGGRAGLHEFETSLPLRLDYEACLAYLLLPPAGGVLLLVLEHKSDYVRFHAWQSALMFTAIFVLHLMFAWSTWLSWLLFFCDVVLIAFLTIRAYKDADTLDRCELPYFGPLASSILDNE